MKHSKQFPLSLLLWAGLALWPVCLPAQTILIGQTFWPQQFGGGLASEYEYYLDNAVEVRHGYYHGWYFDGGQSLVTQYQHGLETGRRLEYSQYDPHPLAKETMFSNGLRNGEYLEYNFDGVLIVRGNYLNGQQHGQWITYFSHITGVASETTYDHGDMTGPFKQYSNGDYNIVTREGSYLKGEYDGLIKFYLSDGEPEKEETYAAGVLEGPAKYYTSGIVVGSGSYEAGVHHGEWITKSYYRNPETQEYEHLQFLSVSLYDYGVVTAREGWDYNAAGIVLLHRNWNDGAGTLHGLWESFDEEGKPTERGTYDNGEKHGAWRTWHANGEQASLEYFTRGQPSGHWEYRNEANQPYDEQFYGTSGFVRGVRTSYFPDGKLAEQYEYDVFDDKHGEYVRYDYFGAGGDQHGIAETATYKHGQLHGLRTIYGNGISGRFLSAEISYSEGQMHGLSLSYYESGQVQTQIDYGNGVYDGRYVEYYENGVMAFRQEYLEGELHGVMEAWYENGNQNYRTELRHGVANGGATSWYEDGTLKRTGTNRDGEANGIFTEYFEDGTLKSRLPYVDGVLQGNGEDSEYNRVAGIWTHGFYTYVANYKHGPATILHPDGLWVVRTNYYKGYEQGAYSREDYWGDGELERRTTGTKHSTGHSSGACGTWTTHDPIWGDSTNDYGPCNFHNDPDFPPPPPVPPENPDPDEDDDGQPDSKVIYGKIRDRASGEPLKGVVVESGGAHQVTTGDDGRYTLNLEPQDTYPLRASLTNYYSRSGNVDMRDLQSKSVNFSLKPKPEGQAHRVSSATSQWGKVFLAGIPFENEYTVNVSWNGRAPSSVGCTGTVGSASESVAGGEATIKLQMGGGTPSTSPKANYLLFQAVDDLGRVSPPFRQNVLVLPIPRWSTTFGEFSVTEKKGVHTYGLSGSIPEEKVEIRISPDSLGPTLWSAWGFFPFIGGKNFGLPPTQAQFEATVSTNGSGTVKLVGVTGFEVGGSAFEGKLGGKGHIQYKTGEGLDWTGTTFIGGAKGTLKRTVGPVSLFPALQGSMSLPIIGRAIKWFNGAAKIEGQAFVGSDLNLKIIHDDGELAFDNATGSWTTGLKASLGTDISSKIKTKLTGSGQVALNWQVPANPSYLKSAQAILGAELELTAWSYTQKFSATHQFPATAKSALKLEAAPSPFAPIRRDFLARAPYNQFNGADTDDGLIRLAKSGAIKAQSADSQALIDNVYPHAEPALAHLGGNSIMVYVYSDPIDPVLQANEIYYSIYDGADYTTPTAIIDDAHADYAPTVAWVDGDTAVAVWERVKVADFDGADMSALMPELEIVYAVHTHSSNTWTAPTALTDNNFVDRSPQLARSAGGELALLWESNAANELIPAPGEPSQLHLAFWDNGQFTAPVTAPYDLVDAYGFALATDGAQATIVYTQDTDGDLATADDQEIDAITFKNDVWTHQRVTNNAVPDNCQRPFYAAVGERQLLWTSGDDLMHLTNWDAGTVSLIRGGSESAAFLDFQAVLGDDGRYVIIWQSETEASLDLSFALYDPATSTWSEDMTLANCDGQAFAPAPAMDASGQLQAAYLVSAPDATTNLHHITRSFERDLGFAASGPTVQGDVAAAAAITLEIPVANFGALPVEDAAISLYRRDDLDERATLIETKTIAGTLAGGATRSVLFSYSVPDPLLEDVLFIALDDGDAISEGDEANNERTWAYALPDLTILDASVRDHGDGTYAIVARVLNEGFTTAEQVEVGLVVDDQVLDTALIAALLPGLAAEVVIDGWSDVDFALGAETFLIMGDPNERIDEADESNNDWPVVINLELDRDGDQLPDWWEEEMVLASDQDALESIADTTAEGDDDHDGQNNRAELIADTNPLDAKSVFFLEPSSSVNPDELILTLPAVNGVAYQIQESADLSESSWQNYGDPIYGGTETWLDIVVPSAPQVFYRAIILAED